MAEKITISFTKEEFLEMLKSYYLGNFVHHGAEDPRKITKASGQVSSKIYETAFKNGFTDEVTYCDDCKDYHIRSEYEDVLLSLCYWPLLDENFWLELQDQLFESAFKEKYKNNKKASKMESLFEMMEYDPDLYEKVAERLEARGIEAVKVEGL